jgi:hypothetical protein
MNSWFMYNYYRDALNIFNCCYVLLSILQGIFCWGTIVWYVYWCPCYIIRYILFRKGNMRKLLRVNKPKPCCFDMKSFTAYLYTFLSQNIWTSCLSLGLPESVLSYLWRVYVIMMCYNTDSQSDGVLNSRSWNHPNLNNF